jgi:hypothetical protein
MTKTWYTSKTLWVNAIALIALDSDNKGRGDGNT